KAERESERFEVDNTPPVIEPVMASLAMPYIDNPRKNFSSRGVTVSFTVRDDTSSIERAQYSIDGGEWILIAPTGGISDALVEEYRLVLPPLAPGKHTVAVRPYDRLENVGSAKTTFTVPAATPYPRARNSIAGTNASQAKIFTLACIDACERTAGL